ncbi:MAG: ribosome biogenesis GTPase YlqF [Firmicutes bacterium]|nr:ribosome biogenesis GTPase YlqF [Bacillota bacterium]
MQWYPGHMAKAKGLIYNNIKLVDLVLEVIDARIPAASSNPEIIKIAGEKPRLLILNKADLADPLVTDKWQKWYKEKGEYALALNAVSGRGIREVIAISRQLVQPTMAALELKGRKKRPARLMVVGIPNVGKSSLINRLAGRRRAATGAKPGITRGKQWISLAGELELLDMPGVLWPSRRDACLGLKLAATGALPLESIPVEEVAHWLVTLLLERAPQQLRKQYGLPTLPPDPYQILNYIGKKRGMLLPGGVSDLNRAAGLLLREFQNGQLGRVTLELPAEENNNEVCGHDPGGIKDLAPGTIFAGD